MKTTHYFFNNRVGIVRAQCELTDEVKYYSSAVNGIDLDFDIRSVRDWGNTFPKEAGEALLTGGYMTPFKDS